jgi:hypothetical protein
LMPRRVAGGRGSHESLVTLAGPSLSFVRQSFISAATAVRALIEAWPPKSAAIVRPIRLGSPGGHAPVQRKQDAGRQCPAAQGRL